MKTVPEVGLLPIVHDRSKDKIQVKRFGGISVDILPKTLGRTRMSIEDQQDTEFCTGYQTSKARAYVAGIDMSPEFQVAVEGEYAGSPIVNGTYPHIAMAAARVSGSLPKQFSPFTLLQNGSDFIADWRNWPKALFDMARAYAPHSPYAVGYGTGDFFDNIRAALYNAQVAGENAPVLAFGNWYREWNIAANNPVLKGHGVVPVARPVSLHAYLFIDWITDENDIPYMVVHLSQGTEFGDAGFMYFDRETINTAFANQTGDGTGLYIWRKNAITNWLDLFTDFSNHISQILRDLITLPKAEPV